MEPKDLLQNFMWSLRLLGLSLDTGLLPNLPSELELSNWGHSKGTSNGIRCLHSDSWAQPSSGNLSSALLHQHVGALHRPEVAHCHSSCATPPFLVWDRLALDLAWFAQLNKNSPLKKKKKGFFKKSKRLSESLSVSASSSTLTSGGLTHQSGEVFL